MKSLPFLFLLSFSSLKRYFVCDFFLTFIWYFSFFVHLVFLIFLHFCRFVFFVLFILFPLLFIFYVLYLWLTGGDGTEPRCLSVPTMR